MLFVDAIAPRASLSGWQRDLDMNLASVRRTRLVSAMAVIVATIAGASYWDAERESATSLDDFAQEQATLAEALASALRIRLTAGPSIRQDEILVGLRSIERPKVLSLLQHRPGESVLRATDGRPIVSPRVIEALDRGESVIRIPRTEAAKFGLHPRTALAGLARVDAGLGGSWDIVAMASAERERDRELWARRRLILSVLTAAGLVLAFGGIAMRNQRKELTLERELAIASLQQTRDERLQRASKAAIMGTLAMGVAHEISTPLGVIVARAEQMLPKIVNDSRLSEGVAAILAQVDRINQVMRGLLGLARGDAPSVQRIDPSSLVVNAVGLVEHRFAKIGIALAQDIESRLPTILGDPRLLEHAIVNLLLNASEACSQGGEVTIRARKDAGGVEIVVEDTGVGISLADVDRALEPFFTTKGRDGGTGLGLAIAHEIVENHRGRLVFSSLKPRGTRAAIRLPPAEAVLNA